VGLLDGKVVVITGAGRGIGRGIAIGAAQAGARVVVADYGAELDGTNPSSDVADAVAAKIVAAGGEAVAVADTVTTMAGGARVVQVALDTWGRIDGALCSAGILRHRPFLEMTHEDFSAVVDTHLMGHFTVFKAAFAAMVEQGTGGSLVGISSEYVGGSATRANYCAAKAAVIGLTKSVAAAGAEHGIAANCLSPQANTRMTEAGGYRFGSNPQDMAPLAVYLLSEHARGHMGEVFGVKGENGQTLELWHDAVVGSTWQRPAGWTADEIAGQLNGFHR
jgi:NAD(P)-dependent dehydrogenase (short-subunit alcohol dehydrogenase family)